MTLFSRLPRLRGRVDYRDDQTGNIWGFEDWSITRGTDGLRVLTAHCEMTLGDENVVRDSILSVQPDFHPHDAHVRIMRDGMVSGTGWFHFTDTEAACESWTRDEGRISQTMAITRPIRGFGVHSVQADGWLSATFPYHEGAGHRQFFGRNLLHSTHHLGASGPMIATTGSGLDYLGIETVTVPAGTFECHHVAFAGITNAHPPYDMWVTTDGDFLYIRGVASGYMKSTFELCELTRENGA